MSIEDLSKKRIKAETKQRDAGDVEKPSSDVYSDIESRDEETGVEIPTDEAVEEARQWTEENQR